MAPRTPRVDIAVIGAGDRGSGYATFADAHPDRVRVVAVAEPRRSYRERFARRYDLSDERVFSDWRDLLDRPRAAHAVVIATQDRDHAGPAIEAAELGYDILLEKPMAPSIDECRRIVEAVTTNGVIFSVCHPLRYSAYGREMKRIVTDDTIGDIISIQHLEPVGYWHQAHSFVRGNWRQEDNSGFMLLTKSCHDLDLIHYLTAKEWHRVSSFGSLMHFTSDNRPDDAADRCLDCDFEPKCPYSAVRIYLEPVKKGKTDWPIDILTPDPTPESVTLALREGPYGRCVYDCDNDVVDHQVVNIEFEDGPTASFTMTAFTEDVHRRTHIFGTRGHLFSDGRTIEHFDFLHHETRIIDIQPETYPCLNGHWGGDYRVMDSFIEAVATRDSSHIVSGPAETLASHLLVFAAERARREFRVVTAD